MGLAVKVPDELHGPQVVLLGVEQLDVLPVDVLGEVLVGQLAVARDVRYFYV